MRWVTPQRMGDWRGCRVGRCAGLSAVLDERPDQWGGGPKLAETVAETLVFKSGKRPSILSQSVVRSVSSGHRSKSHSRPDLQIHALSLPRFVAAIGRLLINRRQGCNADRHARRK
ncbi:hypothetical protein PSP6_530051 [Paraburkholderia tropica]|nr:hypothetical protein PSP6_530051 [Paraburkholderia tropica]